MNCNCKADLEAKLLKMFQEQTPEATNHYVELKGYGMVVVGNTLKLQGYMPAAVSATYPLKKGGTREKTTTRSMFFSFCPFCGTKAIGGAA